MNSGKPGDSNGMECGMKENKNNQHIHGGNNTNFIMPNEASVRESKNSVLDKSFRLNMLQKIYEHLEVKAADSDPMSKQLNWKTASILEHQIAQKSNSKEEYINNSRTVVSHVNSSSQFLTHNPNSSSNTLPSYPNHLDKFGPNGGFTDSLSNTTSNMYGGQQRMGQYSNINGAIAGPYVSRDPPANALNTFTEFCNYMQHFNKAVLIQLLWKQKNQLLNQYSSISSLATECQQLKLMLHQQSNNNKMIPSNDEISNFTAFDSNIEMNRSKARNVVRKQQEVINNDQLKHKKSTSSMQSKEQEFRGKVQYLRLKYENSIRQVYHYICQTSSFHPKSDWVKRNLEIIMGLFMGSSTTNVEPGQELEKIEAFISRIVLPIMSKISSFPSTHTSNTSDNNNSNNTNNNNMMPSDSTSEQALLDDLNARFSNSPNTTSDETSNQNTDRHSFNSNESLVEEGDDSLSLDEENLFNDVMMSSKQLDLSTIGST